MRQPRTTCGLTSGGRIFCDECRLKEPMTYEGNDYFCVVHLMEKRHLDDMKRVGYNTSICWSNNYRIEKEPSDDDKMATDTGLGVGVQGEEINAPEGGEQVGVLGAENSGAPEQALPT